MEVPQTLPEALVVIAELRADRDLWKSRARTWEKRAKENTRENEALRQRLQTESASGLTD